MPFVLQGLDVEDGEKKSQTRRGLELLQMTWIEMHLIGESDLTKNILLVMKKNGFQKQTGSKLTRKEKLLMVFNGSMEMLEKLWRMLRFNG